MYVQPLAVRHDNAQEFIAGEFADICNKKGVQQNRSAPFNPNQNPVEQYMDLLKSKTRCLLATSGLDPATYWELALEHSDTYKPHCPPMTLHTKWTYLMKETRHLEPPNSWMWSPRLQRKRQALKTSAKSWSRGICGDITTTLRRHISDTRDKAMERWQANSSCADKSIAM